MKRLIALCLGACMALTGCSRVPKYHYDVRQDLGIYFTNADAVIESIREAMHRRDWQITISYSSHQDNMEVIGTLVRELMECALDETDSPEEGDYLRQQYGGYEMRYHYRREGEQYLYEIYIQPQYYTTAEQECAVSERVQEILDDLPICRTSTDVEKVEAVCSYLCDHVQYDEVHAKNPNHHLKSTAYAALIQKRAVCQGYAVTAYRLLRELGVGVRVITGTAEKNGVTEPHAWNLVCVDGAWYHLDVTWEQQSRDGTYFLRSDANFTDHQRDEMYTGATFDEQYPMAADDTLLHKKEN